ncbi:MAG TPA: cyclopropane-fatty-acyl-phospholipid synthase family protein [Candidatus Competibacter sp.]|nr:cyclopropane-fatty-acyl-phospholipid synthase family protein [Candidatus Competibacter sp.]
MSDVMMLQEPVRLARDTQLAFELLSHLQNGLLEIHLPDGSSRLFGSGRRKVIWEVRDEAMFGQLLTRTDLGLAETYLDGAWNSSDLVELLVLLVNNRQVIQKVWYGHWRPLLMARLRHWRNRNHRTGSRRNIMAHYDLGNAFYRLWLDPGMSYSGALYRNGASENLESAQRNKYRRILDRLRAKPGQCVLEIGCGWGAFAELASSEGLRCTGLTLSPAQLSWAKQRAPEADLRLQDYRDAGGQFDHVVSVEMFEAVGERWWPVYFKTVARALKPGGRALIQTITIDDGRFERYRKGTDFIQQYIFPGGMLPSRRAFRAAAARQGLRVGDEYAFGQDYVQTLVEWRRAFEANRERIAALGFDERFRRLWQFYLAYCEAGFRTETIDVVQFELSH